MRPSVSVNSFRVLIYKHVRAAELSGRSVPIHHRKGKKPCAYLVPADIVNDLLYGPGSTLKATAERLLASLEEDE